MKKKIILIAGYKGLIGKYLVSFFKKQKNVKLLCVDKSSTFDLINQKTDYDVRCSVKGGGPTGQAGAMVHGISKALVLFDENLKTTLKTEKLTTRDSRAVERKKPGRKKARRSFQFSKR